MTEAELHAAREAYRTRGELTEQLLAELTRISRRLVYFGHLPPSYSPYGVWNDEAAQEVLQDWITVKLLAAGGLHALLDRARTAGAFRRMAERSLRQQILNARTRSQAQNIYWRSAELLKTDEAFHVYQEAARPQDVVWSLPSDTRQVFAGSDSELLSFAWSLGEFEVIRYRADANKLSPLLSATDLKNFIGGLLGAAGPMTLTQLSKALELRFALEEVVISSIDETDEPGGPSTETEVLQREDAMAVISDLTWRQVQVLLGRRAEETWDQLADRLACSAATISNEERQIRAVVSRHAVDNSEAKQLLRIVGDLLYESSDEQ